MENLAFPPPPDTNPTRDESAKTLAPGVIRRWLADGCILTYTITTTLQLSIDAWANDLFANLRAWPRGRPFLLMYTLTTSNLALTPYIRSRIKTFMSLGKGQTGRIALVFGHSLLARLAQAFQAANRQKGMEVRIFLDRERALSWLKEALDPQTPG